VLFPWYLLGALAVGIPIALHLRRRPVKDRIPFSSLLFLEAGVPPRRRSNRIERWVLLAARCLALVLLALLFARPLWRGESGLGLESGAIRLVLLDRSASMRQDNRAVWDRARKIVGEVMDQARPEDRLAAAVFDSELDVVAGFRPAAENRAAVSAALDGMEPSWSGTALDAALLAAVGLVEEEASSRPGASAEIVLVSDLQEGSGLDRLRGFAWPDSIRLRLMPASLSPNPNASLHPVGGDEESETDPSPARDGGERLRLRVTRSPDAAGGALRLRWEGSAADTAPLDLELPPGATRVVPAPPRPVPEATVLELAGDGEAFDNRVHVPPRQPRPVRVLCLGPSLDEADPASPWFFLRRGLVPTDRLVPEVVLRRPGEAGPGDWAAADVVFWAGGGPDGAPGLAEVRHFVETGGLGIVLLPSAAAGAWLARDGFTLAEAQPRGYALLGTIDFDHPVFRAFAAPELRDFGKIRFWKHRRLGVPDGARVLASFDSGDPALVEWRRGQGRFLIWTFDWVPPDSQLPLSTKFVPLVYGMLGEAGFSHRDTDRCQTGDVLPGVGQDTVVVRPDGSERSGMQRADLPGLYRWRDPGGNRSGIIAANLPYAESRLEPLSVGTFAELGLPVVAADGPAGEPGPRPGVSRVQRAAEAESRQKLWKHILAGLLVLLLAETWLASRGTPREPLPEAA
jgi:hypothetical protein